MFHYSVFDGRSPFDDPFGNSNATILKHTPQLQSLLDSSTLNPSYEYRAIKTSPNCEGEYKLALGIKVRPTVDFAKQVLEHDPEIQVLYDENLAIDEYDPSLYIETSIEEETIIELRQLAQQYEDSSGIKVSLRTGYSDPVVIPGVTFHIPRGDNSYLNEYHSGVIVSIENLR